MRGAAKISIGEGVKEVVRRGPEEGVQRRPGWKNSRLEVGMEHQTIGERRCLWGCLGQESSNLFLVPVLKQLRTGGQLVWTAFMWPGA